EAKVEHLSDDDLRVLDYGSWLPGLEDGIAPHPAGMGPPLKGGGGGGFAPAVLKGGVATRSRALGVHRRAPHVWHEQRAQHSGAGRPVVIEKLTKFTGARPESLTPGEYTQLTGRAGRRGIDDVGYAIVLWSPLVPFDQVAGLAGTRTYALTSSFRPTYNMAANLVRRYPPDVAHHLLNLSFAQYRADSDVVRLEAQLERIRDGVAEARAAARCDLGDVEEYRGLLRVSEESGGRRHAFGAEVVAALDRVKPGDVLVVP